MESVSPHILVIDDNDEILATLEIILRRKNYRVSLRERCDNLKELVRDLRPDLILMDKSLGWADGTVLCKELKSDVSLAKIPVIIFSAYFKKKDECLAAGADDFIEKPFDMISLLDKLSQHINSSIQKN